MTDTLRTLQDATALLIEGQHGEIASLIRKAHCNGITHVLVDADPGMTEIDVTTRFTVPHKVQ